MKVYVISEAATGLVKIGVSEVPYRRFGYIQSARSEQLKLCFEFDAESRERAFQIENAAHKMLAAFRETGEWFRASVDDATAAIKLASIKSPTEKRQKSECRKTTQVGLRLSEDEMLMLNWATNVYGSQRAAIVAGLKLLEDPDTIPKELLIALVRERLGDE